jgi:hypothetical protein
MDAGFDEEDLPDPSTLMIAMSGGQSSLPSLMRSNNSTNPFN